MENASGDVRKPKGGPLPQGLALLRWDEEFTGRLIAASQIPSEILLNRSE